MFSCCAAEGHTGTLDTVIHTLALTVCKCVQRERERASSNARRDRDASKAPRGLTRRRVCAQLSFSEDLRAEPHTADRRRASNSPHSDSTLICMFLWALTCSDMKTGSAFDWEMSLFVMWTTPAGHKQTFTLHTEDTWKSPDALSSLSTGF